VIAAVVLWQLLQRRTAEARRSETQRESVAAQLDRRIAELFSLQELSYVLSESIALERVVEQVARYAVRFLQADGAIVVLADDTDMRVLRVAAAVGTLESLQGMVSEEVETALVRFAIGREKIEVAQGVAVPSVNLFGGRMVRSAAVTPLRAHGTTMGALAVVDRQGGPFTTEDLWLLSTVAMQTSVVLANSRLY
jgi:GAF domain-containing protein